jgi:adenylate kinase
LRARAPDSAGSSPRGGRYIGITGTPGTGKKSIAPLVAERLKLGCFGLNDLAFSAGLARRDDDPAEVDASSMRRLVLKAVPGPAVVYGHMLPYSLPKGEVRRVFVLRCEPTVLKLRLQSRGYPPAKVLQNVESELIGLISAESISVYGARVVSEIDTTSLTPHFASQFILRLLRRPTARTGIIDWGSNYASGPRLRGLVSE